MPHPDHHQHLVQRIAAGDQQAYTEVYEAYYPEMLKAALRILKMNASAEDVCNDVFVQLWQKRESLASVQSLPQYLLTSVRNRSINVLKSLSRDKQARENISRSFSGAAIDTEHQVLDREYIAFVRQELDALPARAREVFLMCRDAGYSYEKTASQLGISRNAVKHHMVFVMKKLRGFIEKDLGISFPAGYILLIIFSRFF